QSLHQEPAYAASKGAIRIFTKVTASQHAKDKIRCNSVHPGPVDTEMFHSAFRDRDAMERRLQRVPLGRMGTVAEIVSAVLYLASDDSSYVPGSELVIDGGALAPEPIERRDVSEGELSEEDVARHWDANADLWADEVRRGRDLAREGFNNPAFLDFIGDPRGKRVLDAGCGEGYNSRILARQGASVSGIDISE